MRVTMETIKQMAGSKFDPTKYNYAVVKHRDWERRESVRSGVIKVGEIEDSTERDGSTMIVIAKTKPVPPPPPPPPAPKAVAKPKPTPKPTPKPVLSRFKKPPVRKVPRTPGRSLTSSGSGEGGL